MGTKLGFLFWLDNKCVCVSDCVRVLSYGIYADSLIY